MVKSAMAEKVILGKYKISDALLKGAPIELTIATDDPMYVQAKEKSFQVVSDLPLPRHHDEINKSLACAGENQKAVNLRLGKVDPSLTVDVNPQGIVENLTVDSIKVITVVGECPVCRISFFTDIVDRGRARWTKRY